MGDLRPLCPGRPRGLRLRPAPQPDPRRVAAGRHPGRPRQRRSTARPIPGPPRVDYDEAVAAVAHACDEHEAWGKVDLDERRSRVTAAVDAMTEHRDLLALLLVWEIGKPWRLACADVDRCLDGVRWYVGEIERQLAVGDGHERGPLPGPVSNIASWNYPMSVQVHAELVQVLAGNAVVAKTPSQGGFHCLTLAHALMRRAGLPVTLLSGIGAQLGEALDPQRGHRGAGLRRAAGPTAARPRCRWPTPAGGTCSSRRASTPGASGTSPSGTCWPSTCARASSTPSSAARPTPATWSSAGCSRPSWRCTSRWSTPSASVIPWPSTDPDDPLPDLDFGPVIHATKAADLRRPVRRGRPAAAASRSTGARSATGRFLDGQDTSAYVAPACVLAAAGRRGRCTTPSRSARSTRWWSSTPRPSCWRP